MLHRNLLLLWGLLSIGLVTTDVYAQSKSQLLEMEKEAREYFAEHDFSRALPIYEKLNMAKPGQSEFMYPLGVCLLEYDKGRSLKFFRNCLKDTLKLPDRLLAYVGEAYHRHHEMDSALKYFHQYEQKLKERKQNKKIRAEIYELQRQISACEIGKELMRNKDEIEINNLGGNINSKYNEYAPVLAVDEKVLIFTSGRPKENSDDASHDEDLFICFKKENGQWTDPVRMDSKVNTTDHDASISLSADGQKLLIYRYAHNNFLHQSGDIFMSELDGSSWSEAQKLGDFINSPSWESSASFSADENQIFFTSDRKGGQGGTDIYVVRKFMSGIWAEPENLGNVINTQYDEESPFIHPDGRTLYFSSNGHRTMGGYDIFKSVYDEDSKTWSEPENLGYPINTAHDDLHFQLSADGRRIYFASVREESYGGLDLYSAEVEKNEANLTVVKGFVINSSTHAPISAEITVTSNNELVGKYVANSETGKYLIVLKQGKKYHVNVKSADYVEEKIEFDLSDSRTFEEINRNIGLQPVTKP